MASESAGSTEFYFNLRTGEVEVGRISPWTDRTGPYATREEAEKALEKAAERNAVWDSEDRAWSDDEDDQDRAEATRRYPLDELRDEDPED